MFMRDFWKPMPVSGKLIRELLLLFLLFGVQQSYAQRKTAEPQTAGREEEAL